MPGAQRRAARRGTWIGTWALTVAVALGSAAGAGEIVLKRSVRLEAGAGAARLGDVAELSGPDAQRYAATVVAEISDHTQAYELSVAEVRETLSAAGIHWGRVQLNGTAVTIRPTAPIGTAPPMAMTPVAIDRPARRAGGAASAGLSPAAELIELPVLRGAIAATILDGFGLQPARLRLEFDDRDDALLNTALGTARFEIQPLSAFASDRIELRVRTWSGGRIHHEQTVTVRPMIHTEVIVLRRDVRSGEQIREDACAIEKRWLVPSQAAMMIGLVEAVGRVADTRLRAGEVLRRRHVKRDVLIKRGDRVMVRCLVGGVVISLEAEARSDGAEGDEVELRKLGERDTFHATATGPGLAVIEL